MPPARHLAGPARLAIRGQVMGRTAPNRLSPGSDMEELSRFCNGLSAIARAV